MPRLAPTAVIRAASKETAITPPVRKRVVQVARTVGHALSRKPPLLAARARVDRRPTPWQLPVLKGAPAEC